MTSETNPPLAVAPTAELGPAPERAAFEAHMDATAPPYWRTTAHAREAWAIWRAATGAERERCAALCEAIHARHIAEHGDYIGETYAAECARAIRA